MIAHMHLAKKASLFPILALAFVYFSSISIGWAQDGLSPRSSPQTNTPRDLERKPALFAQTEAAFVQKRQAIRDRSLHGETPLRKSEIEKNQGEKQYRSKLYPHEHPLFVSRIVDIVETEQTPDDNLEAAVPPNKSQGIVPPITASETPKNDPLDPTKTTNRAEMQTESKRQESENTPPENASDQQQSASQEVTAEKTAETTRTDATPQEADPSMGAMLEPSQEEGEFDHVAIAPRTKTPSPNIENKDEQRRRYYQKLYRPLSNPARFQMNIRAAGAFIGVANNEGAGGRAALVEIEPGVTWNAFGLGLRLGSYLGNVSFGPYNHTGMPVLLGGGPSLSLGRLTLVENATLDIRLGYSVYYAFTSENALTEEARAIIGDSEVPGYLIPNGPTLRIEPGFIFPAEGRRFRQAVSASITWQMFVGSFANEMPVMNVFALGLNYFFG